MDIDQLCRAVRVPSDLRRLPGYVEQINPALIGLRRIVWPYGFTSEIRCSLTNCGARHKAGVIIELEDGSVSNIGHICGGDADKFSTKFTAEMLALSESRRRSELLPALLDRARLQEIERRVRAAYAASEKWIKRCSAFSAICPDADREIRRRITSGETLIVTETIERSQAEISDLVASGQVRNGAAARYKEITKGLIAGVEILGVTEQKVSSLWRRADALLATDPQAADVASLQKLFHETVYLPSDAQRIIEACQAAELFFSPANFALVTYLPMSQGSQGILRSLTVEKLDRHAASMLAAHSQSESVGEYANKRQRAAQRRVEAATKNAQRLNKKW